jgi:DNA-binding cell septation regulator SpoVG
MAIDRMKRGQWGKIVAFFDIKTEEGYIIKGFKIVEGNDGLFVGFPSQKKDDEYNDTVWADKELRQQTNDLAIKYYHQEMEVPTEDAPF